MSAEEEAFTPPSVSPQFENEEIRPSGGGGFPPILETEYDNSLTSLPYNPNDQNWASYVCQRGVFLGDDPPKWAWTQILEPQAQFERDIIGLSGTAVLPQLSSDDIPFTHPFGFDWEFYIVPDPQYIELLAPTNTGRKPGTSDVSDDDYQKATDYARDQLHLFAPKGVFGVETDQDLIPPGYRVQDRDRVVVFGRWIIDCEHDDYHSEIHPPLLIASARQVQPTRPTADPGSRAATLSKVVMRPYLVGQNFVTNGQVGGALRSHLINEVLKVLCPGWPFAALFGLCSLKVEAHPQIMPKPFAGIGLLSYLVRPPGPRPEDPSFGPPYVPLVSFHFTKRGRRRDPTGQEPTGVEIQVMKADDETVRVLIALNSDLYEAPPHPDPKPVDVTPDDLRKSGKSGQEAADIYEEVINYSIAGIATGLINPEAPLILRSGIRTDRYDPPLAASPHDNENTQWLVPINHLPNPTPVSIDNDQPFPLYGWLKVEWGPSPRLVTIGGDPLGARQFNLLAIQVPEFKTVEGNYFIISEGLTGHLDVTWSVETIGSPGDIGIPGRPSPPQVVLPSDDVIQPAPYQLDAHILFDVSQFSELGIRRLTKVITASVLDDLGRITNTPVIGRTAVIFELNVIPRIVTIHGDLLGFLDETITRSELPEVKTLEADYFITTEGLTGPLDITWHVQGPHIIGDPVHNTIVPSADGLRAHIVFDIHYIATENVRVLTEAISVDVVDDLSRINHIPAQDRRTLTLRVTVTRDPSPP